MSLNRINQLYKNKQFDEALCELESDLTTNNECPYLWLLRGNLVQLSNEPGDLPLEEAEKSYLMALKLDPEYIEAMESLAHYYDIVVPDRKRAKQFAQLVQTRIVRLSEDMDKIMRG